MLKQGLLAGSLPLVLIVPMLFALERAESPKPRHALNAPPVGGTPEFETARAGGCTFDIECDDGNPCTVDACDIEPGGSVGSGTCAHTNVPAGQQGDCGDGIFCNGIEFCAGGGNPACQDGPDATCCTIPDPGLSSVCSETLGQCDGGPNDGRRCKTDGDCGGAKCDHCYRTCETNADCSDGLNCNGTETCAGGICQPGTPPCGEGAICSELRCSGTPATACNYDSDCPVGQTCTTVVPVCSYGRCCSDSTEPDCTTTRLRTPTTGNPNPGLTCTTDWFPTEDGQFVAGPCGGWSSSGSPLGCPKYASGIAHIAGVPPAHPLQLGPVSLSPAVVIAPQGPDATFYRVGDDYALSGGSQILLSAMRFHGSMIPGGSAIVEFWDASGFRIADAVVGISPALRVQRFDFSEEIIIPPNGFVTLRPLPWSSPESRLYWSSAAQVEQASNDPDVIFVNDAPAASFLGTGAGMLSFELLGTPGFWRAACMVNGECREETQWACNEMGGAFLFYDPFCAACTYGTDGELFAPGCRTCQGGTEPGNVYCTSQADCVARGMGGSCLPNSALCADSRCSNRNQNTCTDDLDCPARTNGCSNADTVCSVDGDCPSGGICGGAGTCEEGVCQPMDLTTGACCVFAGSCTENMTEEDCVLLGGDFLGLGTDCQTDCCPQIAGGADNCEGATVHSVPALAVNDPPYVITISGDNSGATSTQAAPDSCFGAADSVSDDRGWWEGFTLNSCARIRLDFCCSQPERSEVWRHLYLGCPCGPVIPTQADPYEDSPYIEGGGSPFCNDDNAWVIFGLLGPGTYYYPVRSSLPGPFGPYQLHITAQPCPTAACCLPGGGCQVMDQLACEAANGAYLGLPNKYPPQEACTGGCIFGSCCMGLGQCDDVSSDGEIMTEAACEAQDGTYIGGLRCHGCTCVNDPTYTCATNADCATDANPPGPGGSCNLASCEPRSETAPSPCPFCPFEGPINCQLPNGFAGFETSFSDLSLGAGQRTADDFVPGPGVTQISELCVWGQNWGTNPEDLEAECGPSVFSDGFHVRVLGPGITGLPDNDNVIGESDATAQKGVIPNSENVYSVETYGYHLTLNTPIDELVPGQRYWLEVTNTMSAAEPCYWMWLRQAQDTGNNYSAGGTGTRGYPENYARGSDMTFCIPGLLDAPPVDERPCCSCNSTCVDGTLADCNGVGSAYDVEAINDGEAAVCNADYTCPSQMRPENDDCQNALPIPVGNNVISTFCATEDGHNPVNFFDGPDLPTDLGSIGGDVWFEFVARQDCTLRADMCASGDEYDSAIVVYSNGTGNCVCPLDQFTHDTTFIDASDEDCTTNEPVGGAGFIETPAQEGQCFMIRAGFFVQVDDRGLGLLDVSCGPPICGDNALNTPSEECDGIDDALCPGTCRPPGDPSECTCGAPCVCGDGVAACGEECDGADDDNCLGNDGCTNNTGNPDTQCRCVSTCGDNLKEGSEECDGPSDLSCGGAPSRCLPNCTCPPVVCGNNFKDPNEECDGIDDAFCDGQCRVSGDPAGECTCPCSVICRACPPDPLGGNTFGTCTGSNAVCTVGGAACAGGGAGTCEACNQNRYLSFVMPSTSAGSDTAVRVRLDSLHNPSPPPAGTLPDFTLLEGGDRYLNTVPGAVSRCCNPSTNPTACNPSVSCTTNADCAGLGANNTCYKNLCPDSTAFATYFRCGRLTITPEYRDWSDYAASVTYATGASVIPSSSYSVVQLSPVCAGNEASCVAVSTPMTVLTERWGNVDCSNANNGVPSAQDLAAVVGTCKDHPGSMIKPRTHLRTATLDPLSIVNASDIGRSVDAVKGLQYPFNIKCTTATACTTNAQCVAPATCSANGRCTTVKDPDTNVCQP